MILNFLNFSKNLEKYKFIEKKAKIAVGVSGGVDSISLIFLLSKWALSKNFQIIALIVDHKLRTNSSKEALEVSSYLSKNNISNKILVWKNNKPESRIQEKARYARLNIIEQYCYKNNIVHVFFAHHLNDNLETYAIRKVSGSDIHGLSSIKFINLYKNIIIIRPLLNFSKYQIIRFAKKNNLQWVEDPSNYKLTFSRTKIRSIIKKNKALSFSLKKELNKYVSINMEYNQMIDFIAAKLVIFADKNYIIADREKFIDLPKELAYKFLIKSVIFLKKDSEKFKHHKLMAVSQDLLSKIGTFQSQKTIFESRQRIIKISKKYS